MKSEQIQAKRAIERGHEDAQNRIGDILIQLQDQAREIGRAEGLPKTGDARDAARYRWWAETATANPGRVAKLLARLLTKAEIDEAIDLAMIEDAAQQPGRPTVAEDTFL